MIKGRGVPALLLLLVLTLRPHMTGSAYPFAQGLLLIPALVALAVLFLSPNKTGVIPRRFLPVLLLPWILTGWSILSLFWTSDPGQGVREVITLLGNVSVFTMAFWFMLEKKELRSSYIPVLGLIVIPVLASAVYQRFFGLARIRETLRAMASSDDPVVDLALIIADNRVFAGFLNPNMLAGFLAIGICLTLDLLLTATERNKVFLLSLLTVAQCMVLIFTGSVGGSMVAAAMAAAVWLVRRRFKVKEMALAGGVIIIIAVSLLAIRGGGFLLGPENSLVQRGGYMAAGIRMALVHPMLGWGVGSAPGALMGFVAQGVRPVVDPHNFLVRAWISWGLPGLLILLAFLSLWLRSVINLFAATGWRKVPMGYAGFVFGSGAFLGHSLLDMDFFVPELALFGWCVLGAALGLAAGHEASSGVKTVRIGNSLAFTMGGAVLVLVLPVFVFLQGESLAFRAGKAVTEKDYKTAARLYSDARGLLPMNGRFALDEGRARLAAGDLALARELFLKADTLMKASPYPSWEEGRAAQAIGEWQTSIPPLKKALERYKTSPRIRIDLARAYMNLGDDREASRFLKEARRLSMFDPQARSLTDEILTRMDR